MKRKMFITRNQKLKKRLKNVVFWMLLLKMCFVFGQHNFTKKVIVIDPGHGGKDTGAIGINRIKEKDIVLNIANEILKLNKAILDDSYDIYLTRYRDTLISLSDRTKLAKGLNADVFVSLHCNASKTSSKGIEVYVYNAGSTFTNESIALALSILNENTQKIGLKKRGVKFADFQVLRENKSCPTSLIEFGFITNTDESAYLLKKKNIRAMALATLLGIINYVNIKL